MSTVTSELNLILLGPPGVGKGTQADRLRGDFDLPYLATGDMFRALKDEDSDTARQIQQIMGEGGLVPDELVTEMVLEKLGEETDDGFLLDGFPRTVPQAKALDEALAAEGRRLSAVLLLEAPDEEVVKRISGRRISKSGRVYNIHTDPPKHEGKCDVDGSALEQRSDDAPEKVRKRLETYHETTAQLIPYYEGRGLVRRFDGTRSPTEVHDHIRATLATLRLEDRL